MEGKGREATGKRKQKVHAEHQRDRENGRELPPLTIVSQFLPIISSK
jgi:hypothetical protein